MENKINDLIKEILTEVKKQKEERQEYISFVYQLIENTKRKDEDDMNPCVWRINFRHCESVFGQNFISFGSDITERVNKNLTKFDLKWISESNGEIEKCINFLYDYNKEVLDDFIKYLSKVAIPQFLQNRHPEEYRFM